MHAIPPSGSGWKWGAGRAHDRAMLNLRVNGARLWASLMEIGEIGATPAGGCRRLALTDEDRRARDLFVSWVTATGATVTVDRIGNVFARRAGRRPDLAPVMIGSHLDTVPTGGKFDGILGVMAGVEVLRTMQEAGIETEHPIEVAVWTNEEGARFSPAMFGSNVFAGRVSLEDALATPDVAGVTVGEALRATGYAGDTPIGGRAIHAYFELHNEQGPELEAGGQEVGIVVGSFTARYFLARITGIPAHVGPTAMAQRRNALIGASHLLIALDAIGRAHGEGGRSSAGKIRVFPNVPGVIANEVEINCDVRHSDPATADVMAAEFKADAARIARETDLGIDLDPRGTFGPMRFDRHLGDRLRTAATELGFTHRDLLTVAGHDAIFVADVAPAAMLFAPSVGGISHNESEWTTPEHATKGADVLLQAVLAEARVVS